MIRLLPLLLLAACAPRSGYVRLPHDVECASRPEQERTRVECRRPDRPTTAKAMLVGEEGARLEGKIEVRVRAAPVPAQ